MAIDVEIVVEALSWLWFGAVGLALAVSIVDIIVSSMPDRDQDKQNKRMLFVLKSLTVGVLAKAA